MSSMLLRTAMRLLFPLTLLFGVYMTIKGHNEPGGGFIGGLILATALALYRMAAGPGSLWDIIPVHPRVLVTVGLGFATLTALGPMLLGLPVLTSWTGDVPLPFGESVHLATALVFDLGVVFVVIGVSIGMITRLSEECEDLDDPTPLSDDSAEADRAAGEGGAA
ncbi:MAG: MnhB domain-containing protein [Planctomycetota bacterium]